MMRTRRFTVAASLTAWVFAWPSMPAQAQSPVDYYTPGANQDVYALAVQADGKVLVGGAFTGLGGGTGTTTRNRIGRLNPDGSVDSTFNPGANGTVNTIAVQPDGKIVIGGAFTMLGGGGTGTTARNYIGRLNADGTLDTTFNPGANSEVHVVVVQPGGKIVAGGQFTTFGGGGVGTSPRNGIARVNADGNLETTFNPGANGTVFTLAVEPDGQIVVGGNFTGLGGGTGTSVRNNIGRLDADGSLDTTFNPGANGIVRAAAVQADTKIVVGGAFTGLGGETGTTPRQYLGRLNRDGSLDVPFDPGANNVVRNNALVVQPDGKILVGGDFTMLGGGGTGTTLREHVGRLQADGSLDTGFSPRVNAAVFALAVQFDDKVLLGGQFTQIIGSGLSLCNHIARVYPNGWVEFALDPGSDSEIYALAMQPDGKILVGGLFTKLGGGGTGTVARQHIGRINPDGTVDTTFDPDADGSVWTIALQPDGKILIGGAFTMVRGGLGGSTERRKIARLNADGSLDPTFNPGANDTVDVLVVQADGKILVGGQFTRLGGGGGGTTVRNRIGRLNADGTVDTTFDPGADSSVFALAIEPDGQILVGGMFAKLGGGATVTRNQIGRLNADGTIDTTFDPGADDRVMAIAVQPDGKILVGGFFLNLGGGTGTTPRSRIGRLNPNGAVDTTFAPGADDRVYALAVQSDGRVVVGGFFDGLGGGTGTTPRVGIGRLNTDGTVDATFNPGVNVGGVVFALALQSDGKVVTGGQFTGLGGGTGAAPRSNIGRLTNTDAAMQTLGVTCVGCVAAPEVTAQVRWNRRRAAQDVARTTVEISTDGVTYTSPVPATRIGTTTDWQADVNLQPNANRLIRVRGYAPAGTSNASGSIVESIRRVYVSCPSIDPETLPAGTIGVAYATTFTPLSAIGTVTFSTTSALPNGIALSSEGALAGTPTQSGPFPIVVRGLDSSSGCSGSRTYTLTINPATPPTLTPDKTTLRFGAVTTGAAFTAQTGTQIVRLLQAGTSQTPLAWTAVSNQPWLQVTPTGGNGSANLSISVVFAAGLPTTGTVTGTITLSAPGAASVPAPVTVNLNLMANGTQASPFGTVDTPTNNATGVTGAIPFTGWALDDVEVTRVMICRAAFGTETAPVDPNCGGNAQIFVGFGLFIDGARPDVQAAFPNAPVNTKAGWGFMVLTNMLPAQGNGTYVFFMHAQDRDGHTTLLGTRTITCANASATKPFGTIDTPEQGGLASGSAYVNFGWALTPQPKLIPLDGSTITALVDGVAVGLVDYNHERSDIEALFPGYQNTAGTNGAIGFRQIDTTTLSNGLHTISWTVVDNAGAVEGLGSRFFVVSNGAGAPLTALDVAASSRARVVDAETIAAVPPDDTPLIGRRGWDLDGAWQAYGIGGTGRTVIRGEEVDRFELLLGDEPGTHDTGYLRTSAGLAALPVGSRLDAGRFTWAPGVGFIGRYDLVFVRWEGTHAVARREVRIILAPKGSSHVGVQVEIDTPRAQQAVGSSFLVAGWAADLDAVTGTGIDTLHVWAYPATGGVPVFLGTPALHGPRPDVASIHGERFREAGFGLNVQGLAPGSYDLAVFPWSNVTGGFAPAKTVRVTVR